MAEKKDFYFDLVVCIDKTFIMFDQIDFISDFINGFYDSAKNQIQNSITKLQQLRIRVITFTDYNQEDNAVEDFGFLKMPEQSAELYSILENVSTNVICKHRGYSSGLEALSVALEEDFVDLTNKNGRQSILIFSKNKPLPLQESKKLPNYPTNMPATLQELKEKWENSKLEKSKKMLILFCDLQKGENSWYPLERWDKTMTIDTEDITEYTQDFILETILIDII